jgi:hypothetical protein
MLPTTGSLHLRRSQIFPRILLQVFKLKFSNKGIDAVNLSKVAARFGRISIICGGLKSLWWATSMTIEFSLYSAVENPSMD